MGLIEGFMGVSDLLWTATYLLILRRAARDQIPGMPLGALCGNFAWELIATVIHPHPAPQLYINWVWLLLDVALVGQALRYGLADDVWPGPRWLLPKLIALFSLALAIQLGITHEFQDWNGFYSGFGQALLMSLLFVSMLGRRRSSAGQSVTIAVCRMLATAAASISTYLFIPTTLLMVVLYVSILGVDIAYCALLYQQCKSENSNPWRI